MIFFIWLYVPAQHQAAENEKAIREEFEKMHRFLVEEERHRLKVLQQEEEVKKQVMSEKLRTLTEQIDNLSATISDIEMSLEEKDLPFLMVFFFFFFLSTVSELCSDCFSTLTCTLINIMRFNPKSKMKRAKLLTGDLYVCPDCCSLSFFRITSRQRKGKHVSHGQ